MEPNSDDNADHASNAITRDVEALLYDGDNKTTSKKPSSQWINWLESMRMPESLDGETDIEYTTRILARPEREGRFRQCSIGWHDECSSSDECECPCHVYDKGDIIKACIELEDELATLRLQLP